MHARGELEVTLKSNLPKKIWAITVHICPSSARAISRLNEARDIAGNSSPIESKILNSNFKTGAINRSATPPGPFDR
jgi:hypothetical protein